ncbi:MAG: hypothetical protein KGR26_10245 [Cyanobacteria bacterium REEB65]|nr:hypothetical protein [Cyanobacteria bacterium REEB65]
MRIDGRFFGQLAGKGLGMSVRIHAGGSFRVSATRDELGISGAARQAVALASKAVSSDAPIMRTLAQRALELTQAALGSNAEAVAKTHLPTIDGALRQIGLIAKSSQHAAGDRIGAMVAALPPSSRFDSAQAAMRDRQVTASTILKYLES